MLQQAANQLQQSFPKVTIETLTIDVGDQAVKTAFATICNQEEKIDYLLLAAGISESENLAESHDTKGLNTIFRSISPACMPACSMPSHV